MSPIAYVLFALAAVAAVAAVTGVVVLRRSSRKRTESVLEVESVKADELIARLDGTVADLSNLPAQLRRARTADPVQPSDLQVMLNDHLLSIEAMQRIEEEFATPVKETTPTLPEDLFAPGASATPRRNVRLRPDRLEAAKVKPKDWSPQTGYAVEREPTWVELGLPEDVPQTYLDDVFRPS